MAIKKETTVKKVAKKKPARIGIQRERHVIDAAGIPVGRLATKVGILLRGKQKPSYQPHIDGGDFVTIKNAKETVLTGKKIAQKEYYHYSGYPGGLKTKKASVLMVKNPPEIIRKAVWNMLPKNKLRAIMIKRLTFSTK